MFAALYTVSRPNATILTGSIQDRPVGQPLLEILTNGFSHSIFSMVGLFADNCVLHYTTTNNNDHSLRRDNLQLSASDRCYLWRETSYFGKSRTTRFFTSWSSRYQFLVASNTRYVRAPPIRWNPSKFRLVVCFATFVT